MSISARVHGFDVLLPDGSNYPAIVSRFPLFNTPLVELVEQVYRFMARPLVVVDVGAATGDTVFLLKQRCPGAIGQIFCVEGDEKFFELLDLNMAQFQDVRTFRQLLGRERRQIPQLVKHHAGTGAAMGQVSVEAVALDSVEEISIATVDVLKVDVDGFDGEVLEGACQLLRRCVPAVIFEWHPKLIEQTACDFSTAFGALSRCGYDRYLWFNNTGTFSHFEQGFSVAALAKMAHYLIAVNNRADEHFDVIALHPSHVLDEIALAATDFARAASSLY